MSVILIAVQMEKLNFKFSKTSKVIVHSSPTHRPPITHPSPTHHPPITHPSPTHHPPITHMWATCHLLSMCCAGTAGTVVANALSTTRSITQTTVDIILSACNVHSHTWKHSRLVIKQYLKDIVEKLAEKLMKPVLKREGA